MFKLIDFSKFHKDKSEKLDINPQNWKNWVKPELEDFDMDINGDLIEFEGNPDLKSAKCFLPLTEEHSYEYMRCSISPQYFFLNYCKIKSSKTGRLEYPEIRDYQLRYFNHLVNNDKTCALMPRQSGKTTIVAAYIAHYMIFNSDRTVLLVAQQLDTALEHLQEKVQPIFEGLPKWLMPGFDQFSKTKMKLENGSRIVVRATSGKAAAGLSINMLYVDEYALVDSTKANDFTRAVLPTISGQAGAKIHVTSTPRGMNHFHKMYKETNEFIPFGHDQKDPSRIITWREVPRYRKDKITGKIRLLDPDEFKRLEMPNVGGEVGWNQEYECKFLGSTNTLIKGSVLESLASIDPEETIDICGTQVRIFEKPQEGAVYICGVDTSAGLQRDCSAINMINVSEFPYKQVASMNCNKIRWRTLPALLNEMGHLYNDAMMIIENNGLGEAVAETLWDDFNYYNVFSWHPQKGTRRLDKKGITTTPKVKIAACHALKDLIENKKLIVQDKNLIEELYTFVSKGNTWMAEDGEGLYDDLVMASAMATLFVTLPEFQDYLKSPRNFVKDVLANDLQEINRNVGCMFRFDDFSDIPSDFNAIVQRNLRNGSNGPIRSQRKIELNGVQFGYESNADWLF